MTTSEALLVDRTGEEQAGPDFWPSIVIKKKTLDAEVARLAALPKPADGFRRSAVIHPKAQAPGLGLAPGIGVSIEVLKPGERTSPARQNATEIHFCVSGSGAAIVNDKRITFGRYDLYNVPGMATIECINDSNDIQVRFVYSNRPLLEKLQIYIVEKGAAQISHYGEVDGKPQVENLHPFGTIQITSDGAQLMPYEQLINPEVKPSPSLYWPWDRVKAELDRLASLGQEYRGRRLYLLYNAATGNTNGTSKAFFATMGLLPPRIVDRPHRHTAAAINYYFAGSGHSKVNGQTVEWEAGDLHLSAPGWAIHNHASHDEHVYVLTIQDSPFNIAMESMLWQENLSQPAATLGTQEGFATNRADLAGAR